MFSSWDRARKKTSTTQWNNAGRDYSYLSASIGSSSDALRAGYQPKKTPTAAAKTKPPTTEPVETSVGQCARVDNVLDATIPRIIPEIPPRMLSSDDSTRNCSRIWR